MGGGKEEESKAMGPMFPRLHVNDTSKGGPRAPPRNKMALYEQFSVPSQRFNSSSSASTRPQQKGGSSVPSNSSSQQGGGVQERPFFSPFNVPTHTPAHSSDKVNRQSTGAPDLTPTRPDPERRPLKLIRREVVASSKQSTAPDSTSHQTRESSRRDSHSKKPGEDDDFMVPTLFKQTRATEKVLLSQETGDKSGKNFKPLPRFPPENSNRNNKIPDKGEGCSNLERENGEGKEGIDREEPETLHVGSMEDMVLGVSLSPDDVVSAIGHKTFWKARRLIVNQQRVFAVQVFELHRLIKVQKLIAASPYSLQSDSFLGKKQPAPIKPVPAIGSSLVAHSQGSKHVDELQMIKNIPECSKATTVVVGENNTSNQKTLPSHEEVPENNQVRSTAAVNSAATPMAPENKPNNTWCVPPPPNQWLVPVMSPSEGLVYKPYAGPYPPAGSFMSPLFPGCPAPVPTVPATGDFMNSAYGVPVPMPLPVPSHPPHQNMAAVGLPNYFPPFGMQVMNQNPNPTPSVNPNPVVSTSAVEQASRLVASKPDGPGHVEQHSRSSCDMSQLKSDAFSGCMWGVHASKDSEIQGSTASSSFNRGDALSLFPMGSTSLDAFLPQPSPSAGAGNSTRVIKVVPHNPQLATESAARIFQSIQKERKQNDT
ncbi:Protein EARLY FLOWERING 3 [Rhynchospora pubera]|uniref:Protein EARLY FLOWERING 3 n=1 Tax=Rhynchospora pubera TaxID=906938 RepID=A0AAV8DNY0_9POAL|nr:Protein EARLY FLOWERING 3 [Rhynchospora pubera]